MRALTVLPGTAGSARLDDVAEPSPEDGPVLVAVDAVGVCGTDREVVAGKHGTAPEGEERLVLGHESVGRVLEAPAGSGLRPGDVVVGIVRRPDPVPCRSCAVGAWDMCLNGRYTERGIQGLHGFARERYRAQPEELVRVDPALGRRAVLLEPTSIVAKAWEHVHAIGRRAPWEPQSALVTGAGPIGLLGAMLGVQRGLDVHVLDREQDGPKAQLVTGLGATYTTAPAEELTQEFDVVLECTGAPAVIAAVLRRALPGGTVCLTGVSSSRHLSLDLGALNRELVLENGVVFGTVNANRRHYETAAQALAAADPDWLSGLLTREVPLEEFAAGLHAQPGDVKTVLLPG